MGKYSVVNPATGETVKEYPEISDEELSAAIAAAEDAHRNWASKTSVSERASLVGRVAELHTERRETLAEIAVREMGKPMEQALGEVDSAPTSTATTPRTPRSFSRTSRSSCWRARARP